jgi:hypothetical protein
MLNDIFHNLSVVTREVNHDACPAMPKPADNAQACRQCSRLPAMLTPAGNVQACRQCSRGGHRMTLVMTSFLS